MSSFTRAIFDSVHGRAPLEAREASFAEDIRPPGAVPQRWRVVEGFRFFADSRAIPGGKVDEADEIAVPAGFEFDGASVPYILSGLVPRAHPLYLASAALHDWMYVDVASNRSRERADALFLEALGVQGVNWFWAWIMWRAVRAGGWLKWYPRRRNESGIGRVLAGGWRLFYQVAAGPAAVGLLAIAGLLSDLALLTPLKIRQDFRSQRNRRVLDRATFWLNRVPKNA